MVKENFKVHRITGYICNLFLVEYNNKLLLLDSGSINDVKRIEKYCEEVIGRPVSNIKLAVVSHNHPDHAGGALIWRKKYGIPVAAHPRIDFWYDGIGGFVQHKVDCYLASWVAYRKNIKLEKILYGRKVKPDFVLEDSCTLPWFSDWQVFHIPGHTINDVALYNKKEKILYPGDLITNVENKLLLPVPILFPDKVATSFDRMAKLDVKTIMLAHGDSITTDDPVSIFAYMKNLINRPQNRMMRMAYRVSKYSPEYQRYKKS